MFFYISSLRPPPVQISPFGSFSITPQVANDLRTESFTDLQELFYCWSFASLSTKKPNTPPLTTKPQKLTVWRHSDAYKEIRIQPPSNIREGQLCRLVLTTHERAYSHIINLASLTVGDRPFPVMSMPILFSSRKSQGISGTTTFEKQERVERIYRIPLHSQEQVFMTIKEQTSFDLDKKVWDSGIGLSSWIVGLATENPGPGEHHSVAKMRDALLSSDPRNIVELGAGTGIVSLTLGALRSARETSGEGCIIATDLVSAMPLLEQNISDNTQMFRTHACRPQAVVLDWDNETLPQEVLAVPEGLHAIIMADVTYNTSSFPSLMRTLSNLVRSGSPADPDVQSRRPLILLGYKERDPAERQLWELIQEIGINLVKVAERGGAGGDPVEVWIGIMQ